MGNLGPYVFFFHLAWHLQFLKKNLGPISLEEYNGAILNGLKRIRGLGPPISPSGHQGSNFPIARVSNLPITSSKVRQCSIAPSRTQFSVFPIRSLTHSFPIALLRVSNFPIESSKGPQFYIAQSRGPQFPHNVIKMMTCNFSSRCQRVLIYHCVIKGPPIVTS